MKPESINVSSLHKNSASSLAAKYGVKQINDNIELVKNSDVVVLSVKPNTYASVIKKIKNHIKDDTLIVTVAAGITIDYVKNYFERDVKVIRTMPNTPALVGEGMTAMTYAPPVGEEDASFVKGIFESCGIVEVIEDESLMDVVSSLGSSSPAFIDMLIEAMADAAVHLGLPRAFSYRIAAQAVKGSASMLAETGKHPGELKDMVCSPGGTTIEGVRVLEEKGMRNAMYEMLKLDKNDECLYLRRLRFGNEMPIVLVDVYLPGKKFKGLLYADLEKNSLYNTLEKEFNTYVVKVKRSIEAKIVSNIDADLLGLKRKSVIQYVESIDYDQNNNIILYSRARYAGDRNRFDIVINRTEHF